MQEIMIMASSASSSSTRNSNNASSFMQIELWCDHCAWRVRGQRFDDGKVCCGFCGKILQDTTVTNNARGQKRAKGCKGSSSRALQSGDISCSCMLERSTRKDSRRGMILPRRVLDMPDSVILSPKDLNQQ